jgi:hypothetical protein
LTVASVNSGAGAGSLATRIETLYGYIGKTTLLRFAGSRQVFGLDIEIDGNFGGAGPYGLQAWAHGLGIRDNTPKVGLEDYSTDTLWQSVAGVLTITSGNGRSGTVNAILQGSAATVAEPGPTLTIIGPWSCP